jgi:signal transduction histidine kinase
VPTSSRFGGVARVLRSFLGFAPRGEGGTVVSVTATANVREEAVDTPRSRDPGAFRALELMTVVSAIVCLGVALARSPDTLSRDMQDVVVWLPVVVLADLMPVTLLKPIELTMSLPVLLAAAMVFPPAVAFTLGFVGNTDRRELRRRIPFLRGLFNRSNVALSVLSASWLFHRTGGSLRAWPSAIGFAFLALLADMIVNNALAMLGAHLLFERSLPEVLRELYGGELVQFLLSYFCFGSMAVLLASVYLFAGNWGLVAFMIPVFLAHETFSNGAAVGLLAAKLRHQQQAFASVSERIVDERRDERLSVAADLHDEVLPPLFKVHLMGQVIRQDLASGRLLELDEDVPGLLAAADAANDAIRVLIRDLRRSSLGPHGLRHTLFMLARQVEAEFGVTVEAELDEVSGHPLSHLLAFQVAREAINNAVKYADGSMIRVALIQGDADFRLIVEDHGPGFRVESVDANRHFGLQLMRERVELCGGTIVIDSQPGVGTTVAVRFPVEQRRSSFGT